MQVNEPREEHPRCPQVTSSRPPALAASQWKRIALSALFVLASVWPAQAADSKCRLIELASIDLYVGPQSQLLIPAIIEGRVVFLQVDTGGAASVVFAGFAEHLQLEQKKTGRHLIYSDVSGKHIGHYVTIPSLSVGGLPGGNVPFLISNAPVPDGYFEESEKNGGAPIVGTFGMDFLQQFDLEINVAGRNLKLISQHHCPNIGTYWSDEYVDIPFKFSGGNPVITLNLDGKPVDAVIDTGSVSTLLDLKVARRTFGLDVADIRKGEDISGVTGRKTEGYEHQFKTLGVGGIQIQNPVVKIAAMQRVRVSSPPLIIGMRHLKALRLYFAFGEKILYATAADKTTLRPEQMQAAEKADPSAIMELLPFTYDCQCIFKPRQFVTRGVILADQKADVLGTSTVLLTRIPNVMFWSTEIKDRSDPLINGVFGTSRKNISARTVSVGGMSGMEYVVEGVPKNEKGSKRLIATMLKNGYDLYVIMGMMPLDKYDLRLADYHKVVRGFRLK
jgi:predicted aspartyl protease